MAVIDGKAISAALRKQLSKDVGLMTKKAPGFKPGLAIVQVCIKLVIEISYQMADKYNIKRDYVEKLLNLVLN